MSSGDDQQAASPTLIKYMGSADIARLLKGEKFGGQLSEGLPQTLEWNWANQHIVDVSALSPATIELILDDSRFRDVSGKERIPVNDAQVLWRGAKPNAKLTNERAAQLPEQDIDLGENDNTGGGETAAGPNAVSDPSLSAG